MNDLQIFSNPDFGDVRTVTIDGEPWFVGKDVATALGYSNHRQAIINHIDEEDKLDGVSIRDSIGREQTPVLINESGLYSLILLSKLPAAKKFKHWITSEVLPQIRKNGSYVITACDEIDNKERIQIARLIAFTPRNRLNAVKQILSPIIGEIEIESFASATLMTDTEAVYEAVEEILENDNAVLKVFGDGVRALDTKLFRSTLEKHGINYHNALVLLAEDGKIRKSPANKSTIPVRINGKAVRCIVYKS